MHLLYNLSNMDCTDYIAKVQYFRCLNCICPIFYPNNFFKVLGIYKKLLKIFFSVADALQKEARRNSIFQVFESHVPYVLQFFADHSIFGMDLVSFSSVKFRVSPQRNFNGLFYYHNSPVV